MKWARPLTCSEQACPGVNCYARMVPSIVTLGQRQPRCRDGEDCAPLPDQSLPKCSNLPMARPRQQFAETALETATSPDRGASSCLWWHTRTERRVSACLGSRTRYSFLLALRFVR